MKVKVVPIFPISGILPKNKTIIKEMELDLNKMEIIHCMQYGNVFDEHGVIIDKRYLNEMSKNNFNKAMKQIDTAIELTKTKEPELPVEDTLGEVNSLKEVITEVQKDETETSNEALNEQIMEEVKAYVEEIKPVYNIELVSIDKDGEYFYVEAEFKTNMEKLEGNLYGLLSVVSGPKPNSIEYGLKGNWIKFANKFNNFNEIKNGDRFEFRIIPKNENVVKVNLSIKEKNEVITSVVFNVN